MTSRNQLRDAQQTWSCCHLTGRDKGENPPTTPATANVRQCVRATLDESMDLVAHVDLDDLVAGSA